jgi:quinol monooxygenase YgiN
MEKIFAQLISASLLTVGLSLPINNIASAQSAIPVPLPVKNDSYSSIDKKTKQLSLSIKFTAKQENIDRFKQALIDLFQTISNEKNFVNATLHQDIANPGEFLVYETWNDNIEHFINMQMKKPYALKWEALLTELEIKRQAGAFVPFARFGNQ